MKGSTTNAVSDEMTPEDEAFVLGCALGDGCLHRDSRSGSIGLHVFRKEAHKDYALWQLQRLNAILGTNANLLNDLAKGKYPSVQFTVTSKKGLGWAYDLMYPGGTKTITKDLLSRMSVRELAMFWMDDGSLEVRRRRRPTGTLKIERSGWLAASKSFDETQAIADWIQQLTGAVASTTRHSSGLYYLRWHSRQCRHLVDAVKPYILPCVGYKADLGRTGPVSEWLSESQASTEVDDKATRVPCALPASAEGDEIV